MGCIPNMSFPKMSVLKILKFRVYTDKTDKKRYDMLTNADKKRNVSVFILVYFLALFLKKFENADIFGNGVSGKPPILFRYW